MLEFFRTHVKDSIFFKGFLVLLALSFGIWGIGDSLGPSALSPGVSIKAGDSEIRTDLLQRRFTNEMNQFRQAMGNRSVDDGAMKRMIMARLTSDMTQAAVIDAAARDIGLNVTRDQVRETIMDTEGFKRGGQFSQLQFEEYLNQNQYTENGFVDLMASDIRRQLLMNPISLNAGAPKYLVDSIFAYRNETRVADTLLIPASSVSIQKVPTDDDLKAVYDKNAAAFTAPEYRQISALVLAGTDLVKPETIDDAEVKKFYDENGERYRARETRHLAQLVFESKEKADAARGALQPNETLEALAKRTNAGEVVDLGELTSTSPLAKLVQPAFAAAAGEITQPIQSSFGWHVVEVKGITPEAVKNFDEVKDEIRQTIAADKGADAVYDASTRMEDSLASGTPPAEVAKAVGARLITVDAIDRDGNDKSGKPVEGLVDAENFITTAFRTPLNKESRLMDLPSRDGYYVVFVNGITPPTPKPLIDVRGDVARIWESEERQKLVQAVADTLAKDIGASTALSALESKHKGATYAPLGPITRFGSGLEVQHVVDRTRISAMMLEKMFNSKVGDVFTAPVESGIIVARLKEVNIPKPDAAVAAHQQMSDALRGGIAQDISAQASAAFAARYPVEVDQKSIDTIVGPINN